MNNTTEEIIDELRTVWTKAANHERLSFDDCNRIHALIADYDSARQQSDPRQLNLALIDYVRGKRR